MQINFPAHRALWVNDETPLHNTFTEETVFDPHHNVNWMDTTNNWSKRQITSFMSVLFSSDELVDRLFYPGFAGTVPREKRHLCMFINPLSSNDIMVYRPEYPTSSNPAYLDYFGGEPLRRDNHTEQFDILERAWAACPDTTVFRANELWVANRFASLAFGYATGQQVIRPRGPNSPVITPSQYVQNIHLYRTPPRLELDDNGIFIRVDEQNPNRANLYRIHAYSANVLDVIPENPYMYCDGKTGDRIYGVELELSTNYSPRQLVDAMDNPFAFYKHDGTCNGSMSDAFEMVTIPLSLKSHRIAWARWFKQLQDSQFDVTTGTNNGLHIHLSKSAFTADGHINRFLWFFTHPAHKDFLISISERTRQSFDSFTPIPMLDRDTLTNGEYIRQIRHLLSNARGIACLRRGKPTLEVRLFKGIVSYSAIMKGLEFVDAVFTFTSERRNLARITLPAFLTWLDTTPSNRYRFLKAFIKHTDLSRAMRSYQIMTLFPPTVVKAQISPADLEVINNKLPDKSPMDHEILRDKCRPPRGRGWSARELVFTDNRFTFSGSITTVLKGMDEAAVSLYARTEANA